MLFNSFVFWGFFAIVVAVYRQLPHKLQNRFLLVASYIFYGYWDYRFLSLIAISTVVDYVISRRIYASNDTTQKKLLVATSIHRSSFIFNSDGASWNTDWSAGLVDLP